MVLPNNKVPQCSPNREVHWCSPNKTTHQCIYNNKENRFSPNNKVHKFFPNNKVHMCFPNKKAHRCAPNNKVHQCSYNKCTRKNRFLNKRNSLKNHNSSMVRLETNTCWFVLIKNLPISYYCPVHCYRVKLKTKYEIERMGPNQKNKWEFYIFKMYVFKNENPNHYFIIFPKCRGDTCARDI